MPKHWSVPHIVCIRYCYVSKPSLFTQLWLWWLTAFESRKTFNIFNPSNTFSHSNFIAVSILAMKIDWQRRACNVVHGFASTSCKFSVQFTFNQIGNTHKAHNITTAIPSQGEARRTKRTIPEITLVADILNWQNKSERRRFNHYNQISLIRILTGSKISKSIRLAHEMQDARHTTSRLNKNVSWEKKLMKKHGCILAWDLDLNQALPPMITWYRALRCTIHRILFLDE